MKSERSLVEAATPASAGQRSRGLVLGLCLLGATLLPACQPGTAPPALAKSAAPTDAALLQALDAIERIGRGRPREQEPTLQALQAQTLPGSIERLLVINLRGMMAAAFNDARLLQQLQGELSDWPGAASQASAEVVAAVLQARYHQVKGDLRLAHKAVSRLADQAEASVPPRLWLRVNSIWANLQANSGKMDAALLTAQKGLSLAEQEGQVWRRALAMSDLAMIHCRAEQAERCLQLNSEALKLAQGDPDPVTLNLVWTVQGIALSERADAAGAEQAFASALNHARESGSDQMLALGLANYADYFLKRGNFARALELASEALPLARRAQYLDGEVLALHNAGIAKIGLKRVAEGRRDARQAITLDLQQGSIAYAADGLQELGRYLERAGDAAGAIEAYHEYRQLIDQVLRDDTRKTVLEAQERFDAERRAKEIALLNQANSLAAEQIRNRDLQLRLWAALGGCVLLSAVLLGLAYRRVRRTNAALASANETLKIQSERDPLTGLANRRYFQTAIQRLAEGDKLAATVYLIDIDLFKRINDQWGHAAGDSVLIEVAARLRQALRDDDLVVRWGGEEFLIVVPPRSIEDARALAQRLLDIIGARPVPHGDQQIPVTASIGFAGLPVAPHGLALGWERAIDLVDTVMYLAKAQGRNKAYGVEHLDAHDEAGLEILLKSLEAAWREGRVGLTAVQGPEPQGGQP